VDARRRRRTRRVTGEGRRRAPQSSPPTRDRAGARDVRRTDPSGVFPKLRRRRPGSAHRIERPRVVVGFIAAAQMCGPVRNPRGRPNRAPTVRPFLQVRPNRAPTVSVTSCPAQQRPVALRPKVPYPSSSAGRTRRRLRHRPTQYHLLLHRTPWCQLSLSPWSRWLTATTTLQDEASDRSYARAADPIRGPQRVADSARISQHLVQDHRGFGGLSIVQ
jgi:hypothetical protein